MNAASFQQKWDSFDAILDGGSPASETFNESEITSRAEEYIRDETDVDFEDIRVCIHDGYGEVTGTLEAFLGLDAKIKIKGNLDLSGDTAEAEIDDIEIGNVPGFLVDFIEALGADAEDAVDEALEDIELKHTYTPTLTEGQAEIDGVP